MGRQNQQNSYQELRFSFGRAKIFSFGSSRSLAAPSFDHLRMLAGSTTRAWPLRRPANVLFAVELRAPLSSSFLRARLSSSLETDQSCKWSPASRRSACFRWRCAPVPSLAPRLVNIPLVRRPRCPCLLLILARCVFRAAKDQCQAFGVLSSSGRRSHGACGRRALRRTRCACGACACWSRGCVCRVPPCGTRSEAAKALSVCLPLALCMAACSLVLCACAATQASSDMACCVRDRCFVCM